MRKDSHLASQTPRIAVEEEQLRGTHFPTTSRQIPLSQQQDRIV